MTAKKSSQIIALGGGGVGLDKFNLAIDNYKIKASSKKKPKIAFIPTAVGDSAFAIERFYRVFPSERAIASHLPGVSYYNLRKSIVWYLKQKRDIMIEYLGKLSDFSFSNFVNYGQYTNYGNALYPSFLVANSIKDLILLSPLRIIYFLYSPFFWDISSLKHILGIFDSLFYMYLSYLFFTRYDYIKSNKKLKIILFIFVVAVFVYSFGVGNFANAMRHRVKFLTLLVIIVSPFIFTKKLKKYYIKSD